MSKYSLETDMILKYSYGVEQSGVVTFFFFSPNTTYETSLTKSPFNFVLKLQTGGDLFFTTGRSHKQQ